jgi:hypothetical protein
MKLGQSSTHAPLTFLNPVLHCSADGELDGRSVGDFTGLAVSATDASVGIADGDGDSLAVFTGAAEGVANGVDVGFWVMSGAREGIVVGGGEGAAVSFTATMGAFDGAIVGPRVGRGVGRFVAAMMGARVGGFVGLRVGLLVGRRVGRLVGAFIGAGVGRLVGALVGGLMGAFVGRLVLLRTVLTNEQVPEPHPMWTILRRAASKSFMKSRLSLARFCAMVFNDDAGQAGRPALATRPHDTSPVAALTMLFSKLIASAMSAWTMKCAPDAASPFQKNWSGNGLLPLMTFTNWNWLKKSSDL